MAPKQIPAVRRAPGRAQPGILTQSYRFLTSSENASLVRSVAVFGVAVAFFHSSWAEAMVPAF